MPAWKIITFYKVQSSKLSVMSTRPTMPKQALLPYNKDKATNPTSTQLNHRRPDRPLRRLPPHRMLGGRTGLILLPRGSRSRRPSLRLLRLPRRYLLILTPTSRSPPGRLSTAGLPSRDRPNSRGRLRSPKYGTRLHVLY